MNAGYRKDVLLIILLSLLIYNINLRVIYLTYYPSWSSSSAEVYDAITADIGHRVV